MNPVPIAPAEEKDQLSRSPWPRGCQRCHGHRAVRLLPGVPLQRDSLRDVMEVFLLIAAGGRCTLVSMNKRRAGGEINNEDGELKMETARSERARVCVCVFNLLKSEAA